MALSGRPAISWGQNVQLIREAWDSHRNSNLEGLSLVTWSKASHDPDGLGKIKASPSSHLNTNEKSTLLESLSVGTK